MRFHWLAALAIIACGGSTVGSSTSDEATAADASAALGAPDGSVAAEASVGALPPSVDTSDWVETTACGLAFSMPPDVEEQAVQEIDSCVTAHRTSACLYGSDVGWYSSTLREYADYENYEERSEEIDGVSAKIVTALSDEGSHIAGIHIAELRPGSDAAATMIAQCTEETGIAEAVTVFRSIRILER